MNISKLYILKPVATTLPTLALAPGSGAGPELRRPIGFTIGPTPVISLYLERLRLWWLEAHWKVSRVHAAIVPEA